MNRIYRVSAALASVLLSARAGAIPPDPCASCALCGDNPVAEADYFVVYDDVASWEVAFEHETLEYLLESTSDPVPGSWQPVAGSPWPGGQPLYSVPVPAGSGPFLRLVEIETDGDRRILDHARNVPTPDPFVPPAPLTVDALRARVDSLFAARTQGESAPLSSTGTMVVYAPSAFLPDLQWYTDYWTTWGYTVVAESTDAYPTAPDQFRSTLKQSIAGHAASGVLYFHLVGDANDWQEFDGPLSSQYWVGSWESVRQSYLSGGFPAGGQPSQNIIPTYAVADTLPPGTNQARWYPYWTTDQPYADVDDDGVPDVVVTRWPARNNNDLLSFVSKALSYGGLGGPSPYASELFVWDWSNTSGGAGTGPFIRAVADSVALTLSSISYVSSLSAFPNYGESTLIGPAVGEWNWNRPDIAVVLGAESHRYAPGKFFSKKVGAGSFDVGMLASGHAAFVLGPTCGTGDWSMTEDGTVGTPVCEDFLRHPWEGAIAWVGPSAATWQQGNVEVITRLLDEVVSNPGRPMAESWLAAMQRIASDFPDGSYVRATADSYVFFGDPLSRLTPGGGVATAAPTAGEVTARPLELLAPLPNPTLGHTQIRFSVPARGEVALSVYDAAGRRVATLAEGPREAGRYSVSWDGRDEGRRRASTGVYFLHLQSGGETATRKLVLLR